MHLGAQLGCAASAAGEEGDRVARSVLEQEPAAGQQLREGVGVWSGGAVPSAGLAQRLLVGVGDGLVVEPVQRHWRRRSQRAPGVRLSLSAECAVGGERSGREEEPVHNPLGSTGQGSPGLPRCQGDGRQTSTPQGGIWVGGWCSVS